MENSAKVFDALICVGGGIETLSKVHAGVYKQEGLKGLHLWRREGYGNHIFVSKGMIPAPYRSSQMKASENGEVLHSGGSVG